MANMINEVPTKSSDSNYWISWYKELKTKVGKKNANILFIKAWGLRASTSANNKEFRDYFASQGINIEPDNIIESASDYVLNTADGVVDFIGGALGGISTMIIIGSSVMFLIVARILWNASKDPNKTAGTVLMMTPQGRAASIASSAVR
jgi:hypothetical protein